MKKLVALLALTAFAVAAPALVASAAEHAKVGATKCKMCHKVEFESWSKTEHATKANPQVDCETCHGSGGDYWKMPIMKDAAKARANGLVDKPGKATCTAKCHKPSEFKDEMLTKVHARKQK